MVGNIMIIDDSFVERKVISQSIKERLKDVNVFEEEDGLDICHKLLRKDIHVCILDIMLPEKNGFEILEEIKEDTNVMDIPIIVCTGISDKEAIEKALTLGAYDYFTKPLSEEAIKISLPLKIKNAIDLMRRKDEIIYLSYHDKLTGLYNRRYAEESIEKCDKERNSPISFIMGDVNGLKLTNDAFGHEAGDKLLKKISDIIKDVCREDEIISRIGGDEFLILLPKTSAEEAMKIIDKIKDKCEMEKGEPIKPSISFGYSVKEHQDQDIMSVYKAAEDRMYNNKLTESKSIRSSIISALIKILNVHSQETEVHSSRVKELCENVGKKIGLTVEQIENLKLLALLHDIGLAAIPDYIMCKKESLTSEEESIFEKHCEIGYRIANSLPEISPISRDILYHHERWDGSGYPHNIRGKDIPLNARIISVLDTYDKLFYAKKVASKKEALEFIKNHSGSHFDPQIVEALVEALV